MQFLPPAVPLPARVAERPQEAKGLSPGRQRSDQRTIISLHILTELLPLVAHSARLRSGNTRQSQGPSGPPAAMQLTVVTATGRRDAVDLPVDQLTAAGLQAAVARRLGLPSSAGLRLVHEGQTLSEDEAVSRLKDGDRVLAVVAPRAPPKAVRDAVSGGTQEEDEDEELLRLRLPPGTPGWQRAALRFAQHRLHVPEGVLALTMRAGARFWLGLLAWMAGARLAAAYELGPVFIIATIFALMLLNLGQRKEGEWSAYSLFNPGMRRLPGQMTAEQLDAQVRRGNM